METQPFATVIIPLGELHAYNTLVGDETHFVTELTDGSGAVTHLAASGHWWAEELEKISNDKTLTGAVMYRGFAEVLESTGLMQYVTETTDMDTTEIFSPDPSYGVINLPAADETVDN